MGHPARDQFLEASWHGLDDLSEEMRILLDDGGDLLGQRADVAAGPVTVNEGWAGVARRRSIKAKQRR